MKGTKESQKESVSTPAAAAAADAGPESVDRIRDIIFGAQMKDYEARFRDLEERLSSSIQELGQALQERFDELNRTLKQQVAKLDQQLQAETRERGQSADKLAQRLEKAQASLSQQATAATEDLRRQLETFSKSTLESLHRLQSEKTDQGKLAEILSEVAGRLANAQPARNASERAVTTKTAKKAENARGSER